MNQSIGHTEEMCQDITQKLTTLKRRLSQPVLPVEVAHSLIPTEFRLESANIENVSISPMVFEQLLLEHIPTEAAEDKILPPRKS